MWENSNYYNNYEQNNIDKRCCCNEQEYEEKQMVCCKKVREDVYCYYPSGWKCENDKKEEKCSNRQEKCYEREEHENKHLKENYCRDYSKESCKEKEEENHNQCSCKNGNYEQEQQYFKPRKRCCFCDLFNCICGRR